MLDTLTQLRPPNQFSPDIVGSVLRDAFAPNGMAEQLGHRGFEDVRVVDVGAGDGRYTRLLTELGASEVVAIEKHQCFIDEGLRRNWFTGRVICADVVDIAVQDETLYEQASVMNLAPGDTIGIVDATVRLLRPDGQLLVTLVEWWRTDEVVGELSKYFSHVQAAKVWKGDVPLPAHNVMVVGSNKLVA